tara:strand:+ start:247 stop:936 length:690 start_codon:yes stop_codon:yes gene_type:complete
MVQDNTLIQLWIFALIMLVLTSMNRREGFGGPGTTTSNNETATTSAPSCKKLERVKFGKKGEGIGEAMGELAWQGAYEGIYNSHQDACYGLVKFRGDFLSGLKKRIDAMEKCTRPRDLNKLTKMFGDDYIIVRKAVKQRAKDIGMDPKPLTNLLDKLKLMVTDSVAKGEIPDSVYIKQQFDAFLGVFCDDIDIENHSGLFKGTGTFTKMKELMGEWVGEDAKDTVTYKK